MLESNENRTVLTVSVDDLFLDEHNPRFDTPVTNQNDAITALLRDSGAKMLNLAKDIAREGLNPSEIPIAVFENSKLVIIEGNRRVACLKILRDVSLVKDDSGKLESRLAEKFSKVIENSNIPTEINVYVAQNRDSAKHWIELKHTGENNGVGVLGWEAWQTNNFRRKRSQTDKAIIFCKAVLDIYRNDSELVNNINSVRVNKLTTLARLVSDPDVREKFGFDIKKEQVFFNYEPNDVLCGIKKIFEDLAGNVTVTNLKQKEHRKDYIRNRRQFLPNGRPFDTPENVWTDGGDMQVGNVNNNKDTSNTVSSSNGKEDSGHKRNSSKTSRSSPQERFIFHDLELPNTNRRIQNLLKGTQKINIKNHPDVAAILIRVLVELVITEGIDRKVIECKENMTLQKKIDRALLTLDPNCGQGAKAMKKFQMAWKQTREGFAVSSMNAYIHNIYAEAPYSDVRKLGDAFRPVLEGVNKLINSKVKESE